MYMGKGIKKNVKTLLVEEKATRTNDTLLFIRYVERFHGVESLTDLKMLAVTKSVSMHTLIRRRRELQMKGEVPHE